MAAMSRAPRFPIPRSIGGADPTTRTDGPAEIGADAEARSLTRGRAARRERAKAPASKSGRTKVSWYDAEVANPQRAMADSSPCLGGAWSRIVEHKDVGKPRRRWGDLAETQPVAFVLARGRYLPAWRKMT